MDEPNMNDTDQIRAALGRIEAAKTRNIPSFATIRSHIEVSASPMDEPRWRLGHSAQIAAALVLAQFRIVPWLVAPAALVSAGLAVLTARLLGAAQGVSAATTGFVSLILIGAVVTMTMAVSGRGSDSISVVTPLGPGSVLFARVTMVFIVDCGAGVAASRMAATWGPADAVGSLILAWLVPMVTVAGLATFLAVWTAPWVGAVVGITAIPVMIPAPEGIMRVGLGAVIGAVDNAIPATGTTALGLGLFALALLLARRSAIAAPTR